VALAKQAGNVMALNMVLLGALLQTRQLPITPEQLKEAIRTKTKANLADVNLKAFDLGYAAGQDA